MLSDTDWLALRQARHADPFSVLGMHADAQAPALLACRRRNAGAAHGDDADDEQRQLHARDLHPTRPCASSNFQPATSCRIRWQAVAASGDVPMMLVTIATSTAMLSTRDRAPIASGDFLAP